MLDAHITERVKKWADGQFLDSKEREEIKQLINSDNELEIKERFHKDLEFGTGGMRSIIGLGDNRINRYTIRKATWAVAQQVLETFKGEKNLKAVISYDVRHFSLEFARETASVFAACGIEALIFDEVYPTPLLSFAVRHLGAKAGVMITASHNPPTYNGYKVFWNDGAQVTPPHDQEIIKRYQAIESLGDIPILDFEKGLQSNAVQYIGQKVADAYYECQKKTTIRPKLLEERGAELNVIYTALHGTGAKFCPEMLSRLGMTGTKEVKEQMLFDPEFSTVESPNPEEPEALKRAVEMMLETGSDIAYGTDPDTDRLGVVVNHKGKAHFLNGNQIGLTMLYYICQGLTEEQKMPPSPYFVKTIVTSSLQEKVAKAFGVDFENTLTGFKWICGRVQQLQEIAPEKSFIFGTEESFGYLNNPEVRDKDAVGSIAIMSEAALYWKTQGLTLIDILDKIYTEYGFSQERLLALKYEGLNGQDKIHSIMESFRAQATKGNFAGIDLERLEDYSTQEALNILTKEKSKLELPKSNVLGLHFQNGQKLYLRPSGTEPKIKFYAMVEVQSGTLEEKKESANAALDFLLKNVQNVCDSI